MGSKQINACVLGASGYTGAEMLRLLASHPFINVTAATANALAGRKLTDVYPHLSSYGDMELTTVEDVDWSDVQVAVSCLPHGTSQDVVEGLPDHVRVVDLSAASDISYRTYLDGQVNSITFEVPETGICTSTASFLSEKPVPGDAAITGQTDNPRDQSDSVSAINNIKRFWVDGVDSDCAVKSLTLDINNNLQEDRSAGCDAVRNEGRSFTASGSFVTRSLISDSREYQRKYETGERINVALEVEWPDDNKQMVVVIEQLVITEHSMATEANAIASNEMSFAGEESEINGYTVSVYSNF